MLQEDKEATLGKRFTKMAEKDRLAESQLNMGHNNLQYPPMSQAEYNEAEENLKRQKLHMTHYIGQTWGPAGGFSSNISAALQNGESKYLYN